MGKILLRTVSLLPPPGWQVRNMQARDIKKGQDASPS
jgi:hypothetical protein